MSSSHHRSRNKQQSDQDRDRRDPSATGSTTRAHSARSQHHQGGRSSRNHHQHRSAFQDDDTRSQGGRSFGGRSNGGRSHASRQSLAGLHPSRVQQQRRTRNNHQDDDVRSQGGRSQGGRSDASHHSRAYSTSSNHRGRGEDRGWSTKCQAKSTNEAAPAVEYQLGRDADIVLPTNNDDGLYFLAVTPNFTFPVGATALGTHGELSAIFESQVEFYRGIKSGDNLADLRTKGSRCHHNQGLVVNVQNPLGLLHCGDAENGQTQRACHPYSEAGDTMLDDEDINPSAVLPIVRLSRGALEGRGSDGLSYAPGNAGKITVRLVPLNIPYKLVPSQKAGGQPQRQLRWSPHELRQLQTCNGLHRNPLELPSISGKSGLTVPAVVDNTPSTSNKQHSQNKKRRGASPTGSVYSSRSHHHQHIGSTFSDLQDDGTHSQGGRSNVSHHSHRSNRHLCVAEEPNLWEIGALLPQVTVPNIPPVLNHTTLRLVQLRQGVTTVALNEELFRIGESIEGSYVMVRMVVKKRRSNAFGGSCVDNDDAISVASSFWNGEDERLPVEQEVGYVLPWNSGEQLKAKTPPFLAVPCAVRRVTEEEKRRWLFSLPKRFYKKIRVYCRCRTVSARLFDFHRLNVSPEGRNDLAAVVLNTPSRGGVFKSTSTASSSTVRAPVWASPEVEQQEDQATTAHSVVRHGSPCLLLMAGNTEEEAAEARRLDQPNPDPALVFEYGSTDGRPISGGGKNSDREEEEEVFVERLPSQEDYDQYHEMQPKERDPAALQALKTDVERYNAAIAANDVEVVAVTTSLTNQRLTVILRLLPASTGRSSSRVNSSVGGGAPPPRGSFLRNDQASRINGMIQDIETNIKKRADQSGSGSSSFKWTEVKHFNWIVGDASMRSSDWGNYNPPIDHYQQHEEDDAPGGEIQEDVVGSDFSDLQEDAVPAPTPLLSAGENASPPSPPSDRQATQEPVRKQAAVQLHEENEKKADPLVSGAVLGGRTGLTLLPGPNQRPPTTQKPAPGNTAVPHSTPQGTIHPGMAALINIEREKMTQQQQQQQQLRKPPPPRRPIPQGNQAQSQPTPFVHPTASVPVTPAVPPAPVAPTRVDQRDNSKPSRPGPPILHPHPQHSPLSLQGAPPQQQAGQGQIQQQHPQESVQQGGNHSQHQLLQSQRPCPPQPRGGNHAQALQGQQQQPACLPRDERVSHPQQQPPGQLFHQVLQPPLPPREGSVFQHQQPAVRRHFGPEVPQDPRLRALQGSLTCSKVPQAGRYYCNPSIMIATPLKNHHPLDCCIYSPHAKAAEWVESQLALPPAEVAAKGLLLYADGIDSRDSAQVILEMLTEHSGGIAPACVKKSAMNGFAWRHRVQLIMRTREHADQLQHSLDGKLLCSPYGNGALVAVASSQEKLVAANFTHRTLPKPLLRLSSGVTTNTQPRVTGYHGGASIPQQLETSSLATPYPYPRAGGQPATSQHQRPWEYPAVPGGVPHGATSAPAHVPPVPAVAGVYSQFTPEQLQRIRAWRAGGGPPEVGDPSERGKRDRGDE